MKIYLDDTRVAPRGWVQTYSAVETIRALRRNSVSAVSLDHDLGDEAKVGNGYQVLVWMERAMQRGYIPPREIYIHTQNPVARDRMMMALSKIQVGR